MVQETVVELELARGKAWDPWWGSRLAVRWKGRAMVRWRGKLMASGSGQPSVPVKGVQWKGKAWGSQRAAPWVTRSVHGLVAGSGLVSVALSDSQLASVLGCVKARGWEVRSASWLVIPREPGRGRRTETATEAVTAPQSGAVRVLQLWELELGRGKGPVSEVPWADALACGWEAASVEEMERGWGSKKEDAKESQMGQGMGME